jgi:hypothetical protein
VTDRDSLQSDSNIHAEAIELGSRFARVVAHCINSDCPLPDAERELVRMKQRDPSAYRRAVAMFPSINAQISKIEDK